MHKNQIILKVEHLSMKFGGLIAIADLSFDIARNEITALIGPNGAGKTTAFNCITGFYKPTAGMLTMTLEDGSQYLLERLPDYKINKQAKVARTFQNIRLFSGMTVLENLLVAQHNILMKSFSSSFLEIFKPKFKGKDIKQALEKARYWLDKIKLTHRADDTAASLSYGDQRRLEIIRAMCSQPELLCLDEPAAGLNPKESIELNKLLYEIRETGTSILLIEHDMSVVMEISDHVVVLEYGNKISDGSPDFVKNDPHVIAAYLGIDDEEEKNEKSERTPVPTQKKNEAKNSQVLPSSQKLKNDHDNLLLIKGLGSLSQKKLHQNGIFHFEQIAQWTKEDILKMEEILSIKGKIFSQSWVEQAKMLKTQPSKKTKNLNTSTSTKRAT